MDSFKQRVLEILKRQDAFEKAITELQQNLYESLLTSYVEISKDGFLFDAFFVQFQQSYHAPLISQLIEDLLYIFEANKAYFLEMDISTLEALQKVQGQLVAEFGFTEAGEIAANGLLNDVLQDTSIKRDVRMFLNKHLANESLSSSQQITMLKQFIKGTNDSMGVVETFYNRPDKNGSSIFDTYQKADRLAQISFSEALGIKAFMYVGGLIKTSRAFCIARDGKIFLLPEIEAWKELEFSGKPKYGYDPKQDCGGYRCRHHLSGLANRTAMRLDKTLKLNENNELVRGIDLN